MPAQSAEFPKSLVLTFAINDTTLNVTSVKVVSSRTHTYVGHPDQFRVALLDRQGRVLGEIATYDPRGLRVYPATNLDSTAFLPPAEEEGKRRVRRGPPIGPVRRTREREVKRRDTAPFQEYYTLQDSAIAELIVPFVPKLDSIRFSRIRGRSYAAFSVRAPLTEFCRAATSDPECRQWLREK